MSTSGTLRFAMTLAAVAGFLDAHIFQHVTPVFVANHSGNLIKLGMDIGDRRWDEAAISLCAIAAFATGVAAATLFLRRGGSEESRRRVAVLLAAEAVLLIAVFVAIAVLDIDETFAPGIREYVVVLVAAGTMGLQTAALGRVGTTAVSTTFGSGSIARIGEHTALGAFAPGEDEDRRLHFRAARVLILVITAYVVGAVVASALTHQSIAVILPVIGVATLATIDAVEHRRAA